MENEILPAVDDLVPSADTPVNVAQHLKEQARLHPFKRAVICPNGRDHAGRPGYVHLTFRQLDRESDCVAHGLQRCGIGRGVRTILMVKPSLEFFVLVFAMFKVGAVPVMVDPGMGLQRMLTCLQESRAEAMIGIPLAHALRVLRPQYFKGIQAKVTVGRRWFWGGPTLQQIVVQPWEPYPSANTLADETAAILFTTGSTGPAKGVVYTHGIFDAQVRLIGAQYGITAADIDLPTFPLFSLFDPALGMTAIIPEMDPTRPATVNPERIIEAIENHGITTMFASPALLNRVGRYAEQNGIRLPGLKRVISAGAPAAPDNVARFHGMLEDAARIHTGYGATEAMPVTSLDSQVILAETAQLTMQGFGICVGTPVEEIGVRIIRINDGPIAEWSDALTVPDGEIGEIVVKGPIVTRNYFERPDEDLLAKIKEGRTILHRMGDLGWRDKKGRIWFCGRKSQRVVTEKMTLFTIPCEAIFNNHPVVYRSALVGVGAPGRQQPVICVELDPEHKKLDREQLKMELRQLAQTNVLTEEIDTFLIHPAFPVDIRHNAKIFREKLAQWAEKSLTH